MNQTIKELHERRSVRRFQDAPIPASVKTAILTAAGQAPTAGNQQLYTILDITDPALKRALSDTCDHQPFIAEAPMALIFCADCQKWQDAYRAGGCTPRRPGVGDLMLAVTDAAIAAQNAVVAAHSLGLGSCYIGDIMENCETHRAMLGLPAYVFPALMLVLGYPTPQQMQREKPPRAALSHIVHENGYRHMDDAELRAMLAKDIRGQSFEAWITAFCERKYHADFSREMTRSVAAYLSEFDT